MNKKTMKEAHLKFTEVASVADAEGAVIITKNGKDRYVLMTMEAFYERSEPEMKFFEEVKKGLWLDCTDQMIKEEMGKYGSDEGGKEICRVTEDCDALVFLKMHFFEGDDFPESVVMARVPRERVSIEDGNPVTIKAKNGIGTRMIGISLLKDLEPVDKEDREVHRTVVEALKEMGPRESFRKARFQTEILGL